MSVHSLSNLAVQDLTDESAAVHSGGVSFRGFDGLNGGGVASPIRSFGDNATGVLGRFSFTGGLAFANNKLESLRVTGVQPNRRYRVTAFDGTNFQNVLGNFVFDRGDNGRIRNLPANLRNRAGSVVIARI